MNTLKRKRAERIAKIAKKEVVDATIAVEAPVDSGPTPAEIKKQKRLEAVRLASETAAANEKAMQDAAKAEAERITAEANATAAAVTAEAPSEVSFTTD